MAPALLDANAARFSFTAQSGDFAVYAFSGAEEVNKPYEFVIELVSPSANEDIAGLPGTPAVLTILDNSGEPRHAHGLIRAIEQLHTAGTFTHYRCSLVPRLWFLDHIRDHRIFQELPVPGIIGKILKEQGFFDNDAAFKLGDSYDPREYCVQYGESDLHFITRLCEEEGIYFYFEHTKEGHCLCFCDQAGGPPIAGEAELRFFPGSGQLEDTAVVNAASLRHAAHSNATAYREWNFTQSRLDLAVSESETDPAKAPVPPGMLLEDYRYPHLYDSQAGGKRYAALQLARHLTFTRRLDCASDAARFLPSHTFTLKEHPRDDCNAAWWIVAVRHEGEQPGVLEQEAPPGRGLRYESRVTAIPDLTRFVPPLDHPKPLIAGSQTAIVTGPAGEEIYPDEHGRVKVQFFWDREGKGDEKTTCWIRVSQGWAGSGYGSLALPRIGHEVIVSFLEGNPDRPLITGRVYHGQNKPPYALPDNKTRTVFKSMSTPGGEGERGFNELRVEDKKGEEEIYLHAEKDVNIYIKNDWKERVLKNRHRVTEENTYLETKGETHENFRKPRKTELDAEDHLTVHKDRHTKIDGKDMLKAEKEISYESGQKIVIKAGMEITLVAGSNFIKLDPSGVYIKGSLVNINSGGSAGSGTAAAPELPEAAVPAEEGVQPKFVKPEAPTPGEKAGAGAPSAGASPAAAPDEGQVSKSQAVALKNAAEADKPYCAVCDSMKKDQERQAAAASGAGA